jgi:replicative DNA helicase
MKFDLTKSFLDKINRVVMSENTPFDVIKKAYELTERIETQDKFGRKYNIREDLLVRYSALKRLVKLQVEDKILRGREKFSEFFNDLNEFEKQIKTYVEKQEVVSASENDIKYVEKTINIKLKYNIINTQANKLIDFLQDFKDDSTTSDIEELVEEYSDLIARTNNDFIKLRNSFDDKKKSFTMEDPEKLKELLSDYLRSINNKSRFIKSGVKWFNDTFGGWERDRFYLLLAASGRGKSVVLLNSAIWAVKYNTYEEVTKSGQVPIVLYLTLENTITETLVRLLGYTGGKKITEDFKKGRISIDEVTKVINSEVVNSKDPANSAKLAIEYRNKGTQSMEDIDKIIDDIEADGKHKVVFIAIDYIENIKSDYIKKDDVRMGLAQLGTAFSNMAKD